MLLLKVCPVAMEGVVSAVGQRQPAEPMEPEDVREIPFLSHTPENAGSWEVEGRGAGLHKVLGMGLIWILKRRGEGRSGTWAISPLFDVGTESLTGTQRSNTWW